MAGRALSRAPGADNALHRLHLERVVRIGEVDLRPSVFLDSPTAGAPGRDHGSRRLGIGESFEAELFPGEAQRYTVSRIEEGVGGALTWVAQDPDSPDNVAIVTLNKGRVYASIDRGLERYIVESVAGGRVVARELDGQDNGVCAIEDPDLDPLHRHAGKQLPAVEAQKSAPAHRTIDLMVLYTQAAAMPYGYDMTSVISNLTASMNTALAGSGVNGAVRVVHYGLWSGVADPDTGEQFRAIRNRMLGDISPFSGLHALRNQHAADLVVLLTQRPETSTQDSTCGVAGGTDGSSLSPGDVDNGTQSLKAYAVVAVNCADIDRTFHHELTHNLGGWHDATSPGSECGFGPVLNGDSCGYTGAAGAYRTIMGSVGCGLNACPRLLRFSDAASQAFVNGSWVPIGDQRANLADTLQSTPVATSTGTVELVATHRVPWQPVPGTPPSTQIYSCFASHDFTWSTASGTVGWYEVQRSAYASFAGAVEIYRGHGNWVSVNSSSTFYLRVRACNGTGCSGWRTRGPIHYTGSCS